MGEQQGIFADDTAFAFVRTHDMHRGCSAADHDERQKRLLIVVNNSDYVRQLSINTRETAAEGCTHFVSALKNGSDPYVEPT
jgi:neopullulanase